MAYDEVFAERVRSIVADLYPGPVGEKKMFGGLAFLLGGNMAVVVHGRGGGVMVRVDPAEAARLTAEPGAGLMEMRGRPMRGWITVSADVLAKDTDLRRWVKRGIGYTTTLPPK